MSEILINGYLAEIDRQRKASGRSNEDIVREALTQCCLSLPPMSRCGIG
jgi:hypothetical protein